MRVKRYGMVIIEIILVVYICMYIINLCLFRLLNDVNNVFIILRKKIY